MINRHVPEFHFSSESGHKVNLVAADLPDRLWKSYMHDVCFHLQIGRCHAIILDVIYRSLYSGTLRVLI